MPPRSAPADYPAQQQVGPVTLAAEFAGHSFQTPDAVYSTEDYVVVEVAFFGAPEAKLKLNSNDFSLRLNGKKGALPSVSSELVLKSLKDPNWIPPEQPDAKSSKSSFGSKPGEDNTPPLPPKMPMELRHVMSQRVQKSALLEGDRVLPQAGLLFFAYHGKPESIHALELVYNGAAGSAALKLQP